MDTDRDAIRAFIAIPLPEALLRQLTTLQHQLEQKMPPRSVRWVRSEGIHLTLKFLGDTGREQLVQIEAALVEVARGGPPSTFTVGGVGCFPNASRPRVVWVGVQEPTRRLAALQDAIEEAMVPLGFPREGRGFSPHLTLGRVQQHASRSDVAHIGKVVSAARVGQLAAVAADHFTLIRSVLKPSGAEYNTLAEFKL